MSKRESVSRRRERVSDRDYARLLSVRTALRRFEKWSAGEAEAHGLTAGQHQLLLAIRGDESPGGPTIGRVADYLLIRHHSAVELVDRTEQAGLITRVRDDADRRSVRLQLSKAGVSVLAALSAAHLSELSHLAELFTSLSDELTER